MNCWCNLDRKIRGTKYIWTNCSITSCSSQIQVHLNEPCGPSDSWSYGATWGHTLLVLSTVQPRGSNTVTQTTTRTAAVLTISFIGRGRERELPPSRRWCKWGRICFIHHSALGSVHATSWWDTVDLNKTLFTGSTDSAEQTACWSLSESERRFEEFRHFLKEQSQLHDFSNHGAGFQANVPLASSSVLTWFDWLLPLLNLLLQTQNAAGKHTPRPQSTGMSSFSVEASNSFMRLLCFRLSPCFDVI